jgi:hypothetical protein
VKEGRGKREERGDVGRGNMFLRLTKPEPKWVESWGGWPFFFNLESAGSFSV